MKIFILIGVWLLSVSSLLAQPATYTKVKGDDNIARKIPNNQKYVNADFTSGKVIYNMGSIAVVPLNYNFLLGEMHFINPQDGDTLSLANEYLIKQVTVGPDTFYYQPKVGYLQVVASYKPIRLMVKQTIQVSRHEKQSAYDQSSAVSAIKQFSFYVDHNGQVRKLRPNGNLLLVKDYNYYIIDQNLKVLPASKATILAVYYRFKDEINTYLKTNKTDFKQEAELKKLLEYCQKLS